LNFFSDIEIDKNRELPPHPNVVQMFGVSLDGPQPVIVLEYCAGGIANSIAHSLQFFLDCVKKIARSYALSKFD
jgi:serine/threonine protein kinase